MRVLQRRDAGGQSVADVIHKAGFDPEAIPSLARRPQDLLGYLEVHIEQGPVLLQEGLPVGIVTSIAGTIRYGVTITGMAGHAGTVPMAIAARCRRGRGRDRALCRAPLRRRADAGRHGRPAGVPGGAINVIPGRCDLSLDIRAADDATRDAAVADVLAEIERIAQAPQGDGRDQGDPARPCRSLLARRLQAQLAAAVERAGIPPRYLPSGAGHDAVSFSGVTDIAMLFVRCGNGGISHSPLETITAADADIATRILLDVLVNLGSGHGAR